MTRKETDLIIAEQNKSTEEILKAVAKVKADYHELCKLKDMRIADLEKENAELKEELTKKADTNHSLVEQMADLESENAELKEKYVKNITDCDICDTYCNSQLTKAKEIIREFVEWANWQGNSKCPSFKSIQDKAEQFLNEVEK